MKRKRMIALAAWLMLLHFTMPADAHSVDRLTFDAKMIRSDSLPSDNFIEVNEGLANFLSRVNAYEKATVAFLGGSITAGRGWRDHVMDLLRSEFPDAEFTFVNAGIPSLGSVPHSFRLATDVLAKGRIDLLFLESAVNDQVNGTPVSQQRRALEGIVRHARRAHPSMDIVLMAFADETKNAAFASGKEPQEVSVHREVADHYGLPFINLAREVFDRIDAGEFTWANDFKDLHPSPFGHRLYVRTIGRMLELAAARKIRPDTRPKKLPRPLDALSYSYGKYLTVEHATAVNGFAVDPSWQPEGSAKTRSGFVNVPVLVGTQGGNSFEVIFTGTAIGIAVVSGPDAGKIRYSVDDGPERTCDLFTQWSRSLHLPWYLLLADELKSGEHRLKITLLDEHHSDASGSACRVVHFLVNDPTGEL